MRAAPRRSPATIYSRYCRDVRVALVVLVALGIACGSAKQEPPPDRTPPAAVIAVTDVHVDRRFELVSIVERLAGAAEYRTASTPYTAEVDAAFGAFADHPAVVATRELRAKHGISYDAPIHLASHLDDKLELRSPGELAGIDKRWDGVDVATYATQLRDFAVASKLDAFFAAHQKYYAAVSETLRGLVDAEHPVAWFDQLFGRRERSRFIVVPGLLTGHRNFGTRATLSDGSEELFQVLGIVRADGMPVADAETTMLLIHEMAHSYINPLFGRHAGKLEAAGTKIFALVEKPMRAQKYGEWMTMLNEAGVRAVTVLYLRDKKGPDVGASAARSELRQSFVWTNELVEVFRRFQRDTKTAKPDLDALMVNVIRFFDQLAVQYEAGLPKLQFLGPIDAVFAADPILVAPAGSDPELALYVRKLHDTVLPTIPVVTATDHIYAESTGKSLVAFGSPATNPVVATALERARWTITDDSITLGSRTFTGPGLVLVACRFRHDDPSHGVVIYAAAHDRDVVGFNHAVQHGTTDWLVARHTGKTFEVLGSGDFPRAVDGAWLPP